MIGSVLHALDTANFFHFAREGVVPALLLAAMHLPKLLLPDTTRWRAWVGALAAEGQTELVYVAHDDGPRAARRLPPHHRLPPRAEEGASMFDVSWLSDVSRGALRSLRTYRSAPAPPPAASCTAATDDDAAPEGTAAVDGAGDPLAVGRSERRPSGRPMGARVVYISRNDTSVRRVLHEGRHVIARLGSAPVTHSNVFRKPLTTVPRAAPTTACVTAAGCSMRCGRRPRSTGGCCSRCS